MSKIINVYGSQVGVLACRIKGYEGHGSIFFADREADAGGAQCLKCSNILWTSVRKNSVLNEKKPDDVPQSGPGYREYVYQNIERFLSSLPKCPCCQTNQYDIFLTNIVYPRQLKYPRFEDGYSYPADGSRSTSIPVDNREILVWWYIENDS